MPTSKCARMRARSRRSPISARTTATRSSSSSALAGELVEALAHRGHSLHLRDDAARARRPRIGRRARPRARRGRGRRRAAPLQPSSSKRRSTPPGQPCVDESLSITIAVRRAETEPAGVLHGLPVRALVELGVADEAEDARPRPASSRAACRRRRRARGRASRSRSRRRARACGRGGGRAASRTSPKPSSELGRDEALRREHGVVRGRPVALREEEAVARSSREDAVVEDPEHVERRERAPVVLLVAGQPREQRRQIVVAECRRGRHAAHRRTSTKVQVKCRRELTIGELSERSGVSQSALRFYEREGLISARRTDGNQRRYAARHAAPRRARAGGEGGRRPARADPGRARRAARPDRTPTKRDWERLSRSWRRGARRAHRDARGDPRPADDLHRLRLSLAPDLRPAQPG